MSALPFGDRMGLSLGPGMCCLGWLVCHWDLAISPIPGLRLKAHTTTPSIFTLVVGLNWGPQVSTSLCLQISRVWLQSMDFHGLWGAAGKWWIGEIFLDLKNLIFQPYNFIIQKQYADWQGLAELCKAPWVRLLLCGSGSPPASWVALQQDLPPGDKHLTLTLGMFPVTKYSWSYFSYGWKGSDKSILRVSFWLTSKNDNQLSHQVIFSANLGTLHFFSVSYRQSELSDACLNFFRHITHFCS